MANIYESRSEDTHLLLGKASAGDGATIVIPDLQRPYVWQPSQVILLIDSLIRGWPFGTLLMWKVEHTELGAILACAKCGLALGVCLSGFCSAPLEA